MISGFNKLLRNVASLKGKSDYEKRLIKATYSGDTKEPKEKHVLYLLEYLMFICKEEGELKEFLDIMIDRCFKNTKSFSLTSKTYIILHRALRTPELAYVIAKILKAKEHMFYTFQKKAGDNSIEGSTCTSLSIDYTNYLKLLRQFSVKCRILECEMQSMPQVVDFMESFDLFWVSENLQTLITYLMKTMGYQVFCRKSRLYTMIITLLFEDLIEAYSKLYIVITEMINRFLHMSEKEAKRTFLIYMDFGKLYNSMKLISANMQDIYDIHVSQKQFIELDPVVLNSLKTCIEEKEIQEHSMNMTMSTASSHSTIKVLHQKVLLYAENNSEKHESMASTFRTTNTNDYTEFENADTHQIPPSPNLIKYIPIREWGNISNIDIEKIDKESLMNL